MRISVTKVERLNNKKLNLYGVPGTKKLCLHGYETQRTAYMPDDHNEKKDNAVEIPSSFKKM